MIDKIMFNQLLKAIQTNYPGAGKLTIDCVNNTAKIYKDNSGHDLPAESEHFSKVGTLAALYDFKKLLGITFIMSDEPHIIMLGLDKKDGKEKKTYIKL